MNAFLAGVLQTGVWHLALLPHPRPLTHLIHPRPWTSLSAEPHPRTAACATLAFLPPLQQATRRPGRQIGGWKEKPAARLAGGAAACATVAR